MGFFKRMYNKLLAKIGNMDERSHNFDFCSVIRRRLNFRKMFVRNEVINVTNDKCYLKYYQMMGLRT